MRLIDLTGQTFGRLTVIERAPSQGCDTLWSCSCACGESRVVNSVHLRRGTATSCGQCHDPEAARGRRPWPGDPRYLVGEDGSILGPRGDLLRPSLSSGGYLVFGRRPVRAVHVVVCETFHGPRPDGMEVAHRNGDRLDCRASNLRWATPAENSADRIAHGTQSRGEEHGRARLTDDGVRLIRSSSESSAVLAARLGVHRATVRLVRNGVTWRHVS